MGGKMGGWWLDRIYRWLMNEWVDAWVGEWVDGWRIGWVNGRMAKWMEGRWML